MCESAAGNTGLQTHRERPAWTGPCTRRLGRQRHPAEALTVLAATGPREQGLRHTSACCFYREPKTALKKLKDKIFRIREKRYKHKIKKVR